MSEALQPPQVSVVVPCYRCAMYLPELTRRLCEALSNRTFEVIYVNDGSPDTDWQVIEQLTASHPQIRGLDLSRNFGQHHAITAGLDASQGEWVVVMDGDLQDEPEEIPRLLEKALEGYETVLARRSHRKDGWIKRFFSWSFYRLLSYLTDTHQDAAIANFGIYHRRVVEAIRQMPEALRYFPVMVRWVGFRTATLDVSHSARVGSASSYSFRRMLALGVNVMVAFSEKPLLLVAQFGLMLSGISTLLAGWVLHRYMAGTVSVQGWPSLMLLVGLLGGLTIFLLGVVGIYVGKAFGEAKRRPLYLIRETTQGPVTRPYPRQSGSALE